jgi:hypothetical protein
MDNNKIRKAILQIFNDDYNSPGYIGLADSFSLMNKLALDTKGKDKALIGSNLRYLFEKGMIEGTQVPDGSGFGYFKITSLGIDALENPQEYSRKFPFLQIIAGDVIGSTVIQADEVNLQQNFTTLYQKMEEWGVDSRIRNSVADIEEETKQHNPNLSKIRQLLENVKKDPRTYAILTPILTEALKKILFS